MPSSFEIQSLLDAAADGIAVLDEGGRIAIFNRAAERLFGYSSAEVVGRGVAILIKDEECAGCGGHIEHCLRTANDHAIGVGREVQAQRKDGSVFPVFLSIGLSRVGARSRFVAFFHDLTEWKEAEEESRRVQERLTHVARLAMFGEMAAGMAHELNQPLAAITTYAQASRRLLDTPQPDLGDVRAALDHIAAEGLRAGEIIRRLRNLVRDRPSEHEIVNVNDLITEVGPLIQTDARMHDVRLVLELAADLPAVSVDRVRIQQVLLNLVRNAIEALEGLAPDRRQVVIRTRRTEAAQVEVAVIDSGPGVEPSAVDRLFQPFCTTKPAGTGLGLAMSRKIIGLHGGTLGYKPIVPSGACFHFRLPAA